MPTFGPDRDTLAHITLYAALKNFTELRDTEPGRLFPVISHNLSPLAYLLGTHGFPEHIYTIELPNMITIKLHGYPLVVTPEWFGTFQYRMYKRKFVAITPYERTKRQPRNRIDRISVNEVITILTDLYYERLLQ